MSSNESERTGEETRKPGADEMFCSSCGEIIKQEAEICPECGVRNEGSTSSNRTPSTRHDPSNYSTTVTDSWWYGIAGGTILWVVVLAMSASVSNAGSVIGLLAIAAWVALPLAAYFDMQYVRANSEWNPNTEMWIVVMAIWFVNVFAGAVYLYRRHEVLGEP